MEETRAITVLQHHITTTRGTITIPMEELPVRQMATGQMAASTMASGTMATDLPEISATGR